MPFSNLPIDINALPQWSLEDLNSLPPRYLKYKYVGVALTFLIGLIGLGFLYFQDILGQDTFSFVGAGLLTLCFLHILRFVFIKLSYKKISYVLREKDIIYNTGVFWQKQTIVPLTRIQHSAIEQSPLQRQFDLASLKIYTAGGSSSDLEISGIDKDTAQELKDFINDKVK